MQKGGLIKKLMDEETYIYERKHNTLMSEEVIECSPVYGLFSSQRSCLALFHGGTYT